MPPMPSSRWRKHSSSTTGERDSVAKVGADTARDSGPFESVVVVLSVWNSAGKAAHLALYDPEDLNVALLRLGELRPRN